MTLRYRFASAVYHARIDKGATQEKVAEDLNISTRWYQHIEKGDHLPSAMLMLKIFAYFEIKGSSLNEDIYTAV